MTSAVDPSRRIGPVDRAFGLLQLVVASDEPVGVRELARRSGMSRSTTARILGILRDLGMVERTGTGAARPGAALATLTHLVERSPAVVRDVLRTTAVDLAREFGENAAVGVDDGDGFLYLVSARAEAAVQVADPSGHSFPFHLIAPGIVAMTAWSDARLRRYLATSLPAATDHSIIEPGAIRRRIDDVRSAGCAWTDQELDLEVNGLAAPIRDATGAHVAVATLYGPAYRLAPAQRPGLAVDFARVVAERSAALFGS